MELIVNSSAGIFVTTFVMLLFIARTLTAMIFSFYMWYRENEDGFLQVDSAQMEHIFSTLVDHLQIQEAYNIFILNPKPIGKSVKYGYR